MPYINNETAITIHKHLSGRTLEQVGRLLSQPLGRNKDHADKYVFTLPAGQSPNHLLAYLRSISAPHTVESASNWPGSGGNSASTAGPASPLSNNDGDGFSRQLHESIVSALKVNGESFLADHGVDEAVCRQVTDDVIEILHDCSIRVLVAIRGGCVQGALADLPNISLEIHDFDVFESESTDDRGRTQKRAEQDWDMNQSRLYRIY